MILIYEIKHKTAEIRTKQRQMSSHKRLNDKSEVKNRHLTLVHVIIRFVIPVVFIIKLDWSVCICLAQLYDGRNM